MSSTAYHSSSPAIGDLLAGRTAGQHMERTQIPCWRNSYDVDDERCLRFAHAVDPEEMGGFMAAVEEHSRQTKGRGKRCGALRTWGEKILRYLWGESNRNKGICCPSHQQIAEALNIAKSTVNATLEALYLAGFIEWTRRTIVDDSNGPRRKQTSNLYRFVLPKAAAWRVSKYMVRKFGRKPGVPRSIAAALSDLAIGARATALLAEKLLRRRTRRPLLDSVASLANGLCPSPPSGLS
ncbi:MAG: Helix-turn-helix domain protein [Novosphingobium sp.]|nr:Helix-turn-helix domain protein [Novosphingobium sp.]